MSLPFSDGFMERFLLGLVVNFQMALAALVLGLALGGMLALLARLRVPLIPGAVSAVMTLLRAMPVYIAMFFLAGVLRPYYATLETVIDDPGVIFVVLACLPYICAYAFDQVTEALAQWRRGAHRAALLLIPNMARAFQVLVSASCFGAAIGVNEAMSTVLTEAELLGPSAWRTGLFLMTMAVFVGLLQVIVASSRWLHRSIDRAYAPPGPTGPGVSG